MSEFTQGVCEGGAVILMDGQPITIEEILCRLRALENVRSIICDPEILLEGALRQYQNNDCSGLVVGFDYDETVKTVLRLQKYLNIRREYLK